MYDRFCLPLLSAALVAGLATPAFAQSLEFSRTGDEFDEYRGTIAVSGYYSRVFGDEIIGDQLCFVPTEDSAALIPRKPDDVRMAWFCFDDLAGADRAFDIGNAPSEGYCGYTGTATVTVTDYRVFLPEADGFDLARLLSVDRADPPKPARCDETP